MENVKVRKSGEAYFLKLPSEISNLKNFIITPMEHSLILTPKDGEWAKSMQSLEMFSDDIFEDWEEN